MFNNKSISVQAFGLINATIEGIQPTIDVSPEKVDAIRLKIVDILGSIRETGISNKEVANTFRLEANNTSDIVLESELRSLTILIEALD